MQAGDFNSTIALSNLLNCRRGLEHKGPDGNRRDHKEPRRTLGN